MHESLSGEPAPVLVVANSLCATHEIWRDLISSWRARYQVVCLGYAGHGPDDADSLPARDSVQALGEALIRRLDADDIEQFDYVGLSLGGSLGLHLASRYPERVRRLVAANCRYEAGETGKRQWDQRIRHVEANGIAPIVEGTLSRWLTEPFRQHHPAVVARLGTMIRGTSVEGFTSAATAVRDLNLGDELPDIRCPVLLLTGDQDLAAPAQHMQEIAHRIPGAQLHVFEHCAHISCIEQAAGFAEQTARHFRN
jgi:3-oxoadipate enol-lactonase